MLGMFAGVVLSYEIYGNGGALFVSMPGWVDLLKVSVEEMMGTFTLVFMVLHTITEETTFVESEAWAHLIIAVFYYFSVRYFGPTKHCCQSTPGQPSHRLCFAAAVDGAERSGKRRDACLPRGNGFLDAGSWIGLLIVQQGLSEGVPEGDEGKRRRMIVGLYLR